MVERFTPCDWPHATIVEDSDGGYVSYYDYEELQQRLATAEAERDQAIREIGRIGRELGTTQAEREDMKLEILDLKRSYCHELAEVKRLKELDQAYECDRLRIKYAALLASARALVEEVAQEAHTMGRIYEKTLSPINPAIEFNRVSDMAKKKLEQAIAAIEAIISPPRSSPPPADTGKA